MEGSGLRAVAQQRQAQVDGLDRSFSLAKNRASAFGGDDLDVSVAGVQ